MKVSMLKTLGILGFLLLCVMVQAQTAQRGDRQKNEVSPEAKAEKMTAKMAEKLQLSDDQKTKLAPVNLAQAKKMEARKEERKATQEKQKTQNKAQLDAYEKELSKILTKEQMAQWQKLKEEKKAERQKNRKGQPRKQVLEKE